MHNGYVVVSFILQFCFSKYDFPEYFLTGDKRKYTMLYKETDSLLRERASLATPSKKIISGKYVR